MNETDIKISAFSHIPVHSQTCSLIVSIKDEIVHTRQLCHSSVIFSSPDIYKEEVNEPLLNNYCSYQLNHNPGAITKFTPGSNARTFLL